LMDKRYLARFMQPFHAKLHVNSFEDENA